ncbi:hypothetical protein BG07_5746 (plasmid) [Bacillus pseudomycoides]|nr:hypothetical protein DJ92_5720 [Bacillus pseudomycoides]AJI14586.1 hypothetical protein BG07_5746 [Bacillus pseudomycoides]
MNLSIHGELQPFAEELQRYTVYKGILYQYKFFTIYIKIKIPFQNMTTPFTNRGRNFFRS